MALFPMAQPVEVNRRSIEEARKKKIGPSLFPLKDRIEQIDFSGSPSADSVPENMGITPMPSKRPSYGINPPSSMGESFIPKGITPYSPSPMGEDIPSQPEQDENKPSLFGKLFGKKDSGAKKVDEYGLEVPETSKPGMLQKILGIGLPTLIGLAGDGGFGGLAGAATGYFGQKAGQRASEKEALDAYNQQRLAIEKARQPSAGQKDFEYFSGLSPDQQDAYLKMKSAGSMNPLALARFDYQKMRDEELMREKQGQRQEKKQLEDLELEIPGYERTGETRLRAGDAEKLRQSVAQLDEFDKGIKQLKDMYAKYGNVELTGEASGELTALHAGLQMILKNLEELGAISGPDMGLLTKQLGEVNSLSSFFTRNKTSAAQAQRVLDNVAQTVASKLQVSGYRKSGQVPSGQKPSGAVGIAPGSDGKRYYHDAQGNILGEAS